MGSSQSEQTYRSLPFVLSSATSLIGLPQKANNREQRSWNRAAVPTPNLRNVPEPQGGYSLPSIILRLTVSHVLRTSSVNIAERA